LLHLTAACVTAQNHARGAGERHRATLPSRPPSFWRQKHAKPWPAGREHPRLCWGGAGTLSHCKTDCPCISAALLPPTQLGRQRQGYAREPAAECKWSSECVGRSCATGTSCPGTPGCQVLRPPTYLGFTQQADSAPEQMTGSPPGCTRMVFAIREQCCPRF